MKYTPFVLAALMSAAPLLGQQTGTSAARPTVDPSLRGALSDLSVTSKQYARARRVWVYTPPNYPVSCAPDCSLVVAFDGGEYTGDIPLPAILDSMIAARKVAPTIALLIDNGSSAERLADLANHVSFAAFVGDELVPWLRGKWRVTHDPARTIITGSSAGGLASAYIALKRPDLFGNVLSQSGAFWRGNEGSNDAPYEWLTAQYSAAPKIPVRFLLDVGSKESMGAMGGAAPSILEANRKLRGVLCAKGYQVDYFEVPNGVHAPETWRVRLPIGLATLSAR
jgi:enterochelin esterase family protein